MSTISMEIDALGREPATWHEITGVPIDADLSVTFDGGATWHPLNRVDLTTAWLWVAGPLATSNPVGTVVLALGDNHAKMMAVDGSAAPVEPAGCIRVI